MEVGERVPPQNTEAEQAVLGSMLIDKEARLLSAELLVPSDFYRETYGKLFQVMCILSDEGEPVDIITLTEALRARGLLEEVGGAVHITTLANTVPTAANVQYYAQIVREKSLLRQLIQAATKIVSQSYDSVEDVEEFVDEAEQMIFNVSRRSSQQSIAHLKEVLKETFDHIEKLYERKTHISGVSTGFVDLDNLTSGMQKSDFLVVAARPSMGKTTLALNMAHYVAVKDRLPVLFFSLEMSKEQLAQRLLCAEAHIDANRLRRGYLESEDWPRLTRAVGPLSEAPFYIDDTPSISVMEMRAKVRRLKAEHGLAAVFVDYLQLMRSHLKAENRQQEISAISRSLKALAKEVDAPVVALSQLSRAVEQRNDKRPILSDLLESGGIEANADVVLFIYRDDYYHPDSEKTNIAELILAKQRNGPVGKIELYFLDSYGKFVALSQDRAEEGVG